MKISAAGNELIRGLLIFLEPCAILELDRNKEAAMLIDGKEMPRIRGGEIEYVVADSIGGDLIPHSSVYTSDRKDLFLKSIPVGLMPRRLKYPFTIYRRFLVNGALLHIDTGAHPEYATPEGISAEEFLYYEVAGDRHLEAIVGRMNEELFLKGTRTRIRLFKNNVDTLGNTYGAHESYLTLRRVKEQLFNNESYWGLFFPYLITRHIFLGSGRVCRNKNRGLHYSASQRASHFSHLMGGGTTSDRAMVSTRDEPLADIGKYFRLHVIEGDSNISETAIYIKTGIMDMVLDAFECDFIRDVPWGRVVEEEMLGAYRVFTEDSTLKATYPFGGIEISALGIQRWYWKMLCSFYKENDRLTPERKKLLSLLGKLIRLAESPVPHRALYPYVDAAAKRLLIEEDMERRSYSWGDDPNRKIEFHRGNRVSERTIFAHAKSIDFQYHEICPLGLARVLMKRKKLMRRTSEKVLASILCKPFPTIRPHARYEVFDWGDRESEESGLPRDVLADWISMRIRSDKGDTIAHFKMMDPWDQHMPPKELPPPPSEAPEASPANEGGE